jgi:hypothetical protein
VVHAGCIPNIGFLLIELGGLITINQIKLPIASMAAAKMLLLVNWILTII